MATDANGYLITTYVTWPTSAQGFNPVTLTGAKVGDLAGPAITPTSAIRLIRTGWDSVAQPYGTGGVQDGVVIALYSQRHHGCVLHSQRLHPPLG